MIELALICLVFFVYRKSIDGEFVFDDIGGIANNRWVQKGDWRSAWGSQRKLVYLLYALQVRLFGMDPKRVNQPKPESFHYINIAVHAINSILVAHAFNYVAGIIFAVHPLAVNAIANISGLPAALSSAFMLGAILAVFSGYWWLAPPLYVVAVLTKEDSAVLPVTIALLLMVQGSPSSLLLLPVLGAYVFYRRAWFLELLTLDYSKAVRKAGYLGALPQPLHLTTFFAESVLRFPRWFLGYGFNPDPDIRPTEWRDRRFRMAAGVFVAAIVAAILMGNSVVWMALVLMVVSPWACYAVIPLADVIFEHRAYFSMTGIALLWSIIVTAIPLGVPLVLAGLVLWFGRTTIWRAQQWAREIDLWQMAISSGSPDKVRVWINLGTAYINLATRLNDEEQRNRALSKATTWLGKAVKQNPMASTAWGNLGNISVMVDQPAAAEHCYRKALKANPESGGAWFVLGNLYNSQQRFGRAEVCYRRAVKFTPDLEAAWNKLGILQIRRKQLDLALESFSRVLAMKPDDKLYEYNVASVLLALNRKEEAREHLARVPASMMI